MRTLLTAVIVSVGVAALGFGPGAAAQLTAVPFPPVPPVLVVPIAAPLLPTRPISAAFLVLPLPPAPPAPPASSFWASPAVSIGSSQLSMPLARHHRSLTLGWRRGDSQLGTRNAQPVSTQFPMALARHQRWMKPGTGNREPGTVFSQAWAQLPESFAPQDPADSLWRQGRSLLNRSEYRDAASVFRVIHTDSRYAGSAYRPGAYYYEAFALFRGGSMDELRRARGLLVQMRDQYPRDRQIRDAEQLEARITGALARMGDAEAADQLQQQAEGGVIGEGGQCPDEDDDVRVVALNALLQMNSDQAVPILREVLARRDACSAALRERALFVLSQQRSEGIDQTLLDVARNDPDADVREAAVHWLSQVNTPEAVAALEEILRTSRDPEVQENALFALSQNRSDRAQEILRNYASRNDVPVDLRGTAIHWLTQQRGEENRRFLRELYTGIDDDELKGNIMFAVAQSPDAESLDWMIRIALSESESVEVRKNALFHAAMHGRLPTARLVEVYDRADDRELREHVIFLLSQRSRDQAAIDKLMDIVTNDSDPELRNSAVHWLGQIRDPRVTQFLLDIVKR